MVPEMAGLAVEEVDGLFRGPWFNAYKRIRKESVLNGIETTDKARSVEP